MTGTRKYAVEILARTGAESDLIDEALAGLAAQGIWVHSNRETDTTTGKRLIPVPLSEYIVSA
jgi:hypothetical protein